MNRNFVPASIQRSISSNVSGTESHLTEVHLAARVVPFVDLTVKPFEFPVIIQVPGEDLLTALNLNGSDLSTTRACDLTMEAGSMIFVGGLIRSPFAITRIRDPTSLTVTKNWFL
jgi:hypothetical protein